MKHFVRSALLALSLFSVPVLAEQTQKPAPAAADETITLRAGNSKSLTIPGGNVIRIDGLKAGETTLIIWTGNVRKSYHIVVK
jgi:hypothetical protein